MSEEEAKQVWDKLFQKLSEKEKTFLAIANNEKNKEIERLNNIINELEKYIKDTKQDGYKLVWINKENSYFEAGIEEILGDDKE